MNKTSYFTGYDHSTHITSISYVVSVETTAGETTEVFYSNNSNYYLQQNDRIMYIKVALVFVLGEF